MSILGSEPIQIIYEAFLAQIQSVLLCLLYVFLLPLLSQFVSRSSHFSIFVIQIGQTVSVLPREHLQIETILIIVIEIGGCGISRILMVFQILTIFGSI